MELRASTPRITVSFSVEADNHHEKDAFVREWLQHVDAVRVNNIYKPSHSLKASINSDDLPISQKRTPCRELYDQMIVDWNGDVRVCCIDGKRQTNLGNVFRDGVQGVWRGPALTALREGHERGEYGEFCTPCTTWATFNLNRQYNRGNLLVRRSQGTVFYNRKDRLYTWVEPLHRNDYGLTSEGNTTVDVVETAMPQATPAFGLVGAGRAI